MIDWHRLFGLALTDFFTDSPFVVELEKDLSVKRQLLDVVILKKQAGEFSGHIPDGLDNVAIHNLLSYKSLHEPLDDWALDELTGHYVNYRKQASPSLDELLPKDQFRLYGVSTRFPQLLANQVRLKRLQAGVYEVVWGVNRIRVLVLNEMPAAEHNAIWHLFSGIREKVMSGAVQYRSHTGEMSTIINQLFENYQLEGIGMPYTMEDFKRDYTKNHLNLLTAEEVLPRFSTEDRLQGLSTEEVLQRLSFEEINAYLEKRKKQRKHAKK